MKKYRHVRQLDDWGCGVACAASLLGISYKEARDSLASIKGKGVDCWPKGLSPRMLAKLISSHKATYKQSRRVNFWPIGTIVFLSEEEGRYEGSGHYMLKARDGWMDPLATTKEQPKGARFRARLPSNTKVQAALVWRQATS